jgi:2-polyprenyl-6-methoxyphenol hydroxylase-like FAD-dependent oxidoreductase
LFLVCDGFNSKTREFLKIEKIETEIGYGVVALFNNLDNEVKNNRDDVLGINQNRYRGFKSATGHISLHLTKDEFELISTSVKNGSELPIYIQEVLQSGANFYKMTLPDLENIKIFLIPVKTFIAEEISKFKDSNLFLLLGDAANGPNFISARGVNIGIKMARELHKIIDIHSLEELHFEYEKRVEYLLLETMDNLLNFTYDINTVEYIYKKYEYCTEQLDYIGNRCYKFTVF